MSHTVVDEQLAIIGGPLAVPNSDQHDEMFRWQILTDEDEQAVLGVLRARTMSDIDITTQFEVEYARYNGARMRSVIRMEPWHFRWPCGLPDCAAVTN